MLCGDTMQRSRIAAHFGALGYLDGWDCFALPAGCLSRWYQVHLTSDPFVGRQTLAVLPGDSPLGAHQQGSESLAVAV